MRPLSLFAAGVRRTAEINAATVSRFCVLLGVATLLAGFDGRAAAAPLAAVAAVGDALAVILCCIGGLAVAGLIGAATLAPLRGRRPLATLLGEGFGAGLSAGLLATTFLAAVAALFQAARLADAI